MAHITFAFAWLFSLPAFNNKKFTFYIFTFWILLLFLALRYGYGTDYWSYVNKHNTAYIGSGSVWDQKEVLFTYLNVLVPDFNLLIVLLSVFYIFTVHYLVKTSNLSKRHYWFAILIWLINPYLFLVHLSGIRQTIAICIFVFAVNFIIKRKSLPFFLLVLIAAGFHQSALFLLPFYFFLNEKKIGKFGFVSVISTLLILLFTPLFNVILNQVVLYFPKYFIYVQSIEQNSLRSILMTSIIFLLIFLNINKLEGKEMIYGKLALIATGFALLSIEFNMIGRVGMYFDVFLIVAIPMIISKIKVMAFRQISIMLIIAIYLLRYTSFFVNNVGYDSYKTILGY
ncbi:EpsG family protein [Rossellomorea marisflavi]|uniref:EpsG family protein n=1 Tax=Rossellomorea marisflavi TaxID=189381 RepID=UPI00064E1A6D|nr:EpsG family protein [Rossellomorea marisflavi]KMK93110.1 hypothetical protein VL03_14840 [Rossellomorea marisflavi]